MPSYQNPKFDKEQYRYRRNKGWRGQFGVPIHNTHHFSTSEWEPRPDGKKSARKKLTHQEKEAAHAATSIR